MNHLGTIYLETERLALRKLSIVDAETMYQNWASDSTVAKYVGWNPHENLGITRDFLNDCVNNYISFDTYNWGIVIKKSNTLIGTIGVVNFSEKHQFAELGYVIGSPWWNHGYATEALKKVLDFLLSEVHFSCIETRCYEQNYASSRVMQKAGMKYDTCLRSRVLDKTTGLRDNLVIYSMLADELPK
ncbi:MAG: GNAT family N-acetyltransferase [Clostridia bacterium]